MGMVPRKKTKVAALQPTVCAAGCRHGCPSRYSVKWRRPLSTSLPRHFVLLNLEIRAVSPKTEGLGCPSAPPESLERAQVSATAPPREPRFSASARSPAHLRGLLLMDVTFQGDLGRPERALSGSPGTHLSALCRGAPPQPTDNLRPRPAPYPPRPSLTNPAHPAPRTPPGFLAPRRAGMVMALCERFSNFFWNDASCASSGGRTCPGGGCWQGQQPGSCRPRVPVFSVRSEDRCSSGERPCSLEGGGREVVRLAAPAHTPTPRSRASSLRTAASGSH